MVLGDCLGVLRGVVLRLLDLLRLLGEALVLVWVGGVPRIFE